MSTAPAPSRTEWVKSSYSGNGGGNCVEWAPSHVDSGIVPVRDSKSPETPALVFEPSAWSSFVTALQHDEFRAL
ncbi:DUF397 domain-containing protein [Streptomyces sp. ML-6]|uniref:DUF397 domain-containing protein n=1 Tax=Streptomyces sp. ML-6 TaxID=2982693 RepID=UPI0024BF942C|nr:DUF397 domain-containing protein [Streptomyces sp. ML-6]MDK0520000.1 DUF397 domain-containing protein [Streptomyces sp. ML-6]